MKKLFLISFAILAFATNAQTTPSYPTVKLTKPSTGAGTDDVLTIGASKTINKVSKSSLLSGLATTTYVNAADATKEPTITDGSTSEYWRGDKTWQPMNAWAVGLQNVDNTSDYDKPISAATQLELNKKANANEVFNLSGSNQVLGDNEFLGTIKISVNGDGSQGFLAQYGGGSTKLKAGGIEVQDFYHPTGSLFISTSPGLEDDVHNYIYFPNKSGQIAINEYGDGITGDKFVKSGGTASQFLKADGSVDNTDYVPSSRTITINGTTLDLTQDREWTIDLSGNFVDLSNNQTIDGIKSFQKDLIIRGCRVGPYSGIGGSNVVFGVNALANPNNGYCSFNTAIGENSLQNFGSVGAIGLGYNSLKYLETGGTVIGIGGNSGITYSSGENIIEANSCLYIGNSTLSGETYPISPNNEIVIGDNAVGAGTNTVTLGGVSITKTILRGTINMAGLPTYADNAAATTGGLIVGDIYRTSTGDLKIVY